MRLLIVEDERQIRILIKSLIPFEKLGFELIGEASNGLEALEFCKKNKPDIIITDINMPLVTGLDLIKGLYELLPEIKILIISGYDYFEYAKTAIKYGVSDYLLKPVDENELVQALLRIKNVILKEGIGYLEKINFQQTPENLSDYISQLSLDILKLYSKNNDANPIEIAKIFIEKNYWQNISLVQIAECMHFNPTYFSELFKKTMNCNFTEYRTHIRIENAKKLLFGTEYTVNDIGNKVGYSNTKHFFKLFKKVTGMTPSEFRASKQ